MARCCRMKVIPSRIWPTSSPTARPAASPAEAAIRSGSTFGSGRIAAAAAKNITDTVTYTAIGPNTFSTSGPRKPKPMANVALIVSTKIELAAIRLRRSTMRGIDVSSAGAKMAVAVPTMKLMR